MATSGLALAQMAPAPQMEGYPPSGWATNSGIVIPTTPRSSPPVTPSAAFVTRSDAPVGATSSTGANLTGATDSTIGNVPGVSFASTSQLVTTVPSGAPPQGYAEQTGTLGGITVSTEGTATPGFFNPGVGQFSSAYTPSPVGSTYDTVPVSDNRSLAELAAENRARAQQARNVRMFTNQEIQLMDQQRGVTTAAISPVPGTGGTAGAAEGAWITATGRPRETQPATGAGTAVASPFSPAAPAASEQPQASEAPGTETTQTPPAGQEEARLPATASMLPVILIVGTLAIVAGVLGKKYRRLGLRSGRS
ncbi:MAG: hypothetical protein ACE14M_04870 [Terriglobales bacterium]